MSDEIVDATTTTKPWSGRFSKPEIDEDDQERFVVYLSMPTDAGESRTLERLVEHIDEDTAVRHCHTLINTFLADAFKPGMHSNVLFELYRRKGPDPYIVLESGVCFKQAYAFNAWSYTELVCFELCGAKPAEPSRLLDLLKGRYSEYNRLQLAAHLLQSREVRVTRQYEGTLLKVTSGTLGKIGLGSPYISGWEFDWSVELPVIFQRDGMDDITLGIPYEYLELVQNDEEYLEQIIIASRARIQAEAERG